MGIFSKFMHHESSDEKIAKEIAIITPLSIYEARCLIRSLLCLIDLYISYNRPIDELHEKLSKLKWQAVFDSEKLAVKE